MEQGRQRIGYGNDPGAERNVGADQPAWIPFAVETLMVAENHIRNAMPAKRIHRVDDGSSDSRMVSHPVPFFRAERPLFFQDHVRNADFTDIVQVPGQMNHFRLVRRLSQSSCEHLADDRYFLGVMEGRGVPRIDGIAQGFGKLMELTGLQSESGGARNGPHREMKARCQHIDTRLRPVAFAA